MSWSPPGRFGFLSFADDTTISADLGYTVAQYPAVIQAFSASLPAAPAAASYIVDGIRSHVVEGQYNLAPGYLPWMSEMVSDSSTWSDVVVDVDAGRTDAGPIDAGPAEAGR